MADNWNKPLGKGETNTIEDDGDIGHRGNKFKLIVIYFSVCQLQALLWECSNTLDDEDGVVRREKLVPEKRM